MQLYKRNHCNENFTDKTTVFSIKMLGFFFTFIHVVRISFDLFSPFTISKYNSTLTPDEQARFDRFQIVAFFQNRPTVCRSSGDHRLTLYR